MDTSILEEQITRFEQITEERANKIKLLNIQQKEELSLIKQMKKTLERLKTKE